MSWSFNVAAVPVADLHDELQAAAERYRSTSVPPEDDTFVVEQITAAIDAAVLIAATVLPTDGGVVHATLSGHINPDHQPRAGYANDTVTVTVTQAAPPVPEPEPSESVIAAEPLPEAPETVQTSESTSESAEQPS